MATLKLATTAAGFPALDAVGLSSPLALVVCLVAGGPILLRAWYDSYRYVRGLDRRRLPRPNRQGA
jgi:hypothetical protein